MDGVPRVPEQRRPGSSAGAGTDTGSTAGAMVDAASTAGAGIDTRPATRASASVGSGAGAGVDALGAVGGGGDTTSTDPVPLRFGVLGPVRARRGDELLNTGSPQQRALLAALLLREGRTAPAAELISALWGEEPPDQALAAVRTYASRLRKI